MIVISEGLYTFNDMVALTTATLFRIHINCNDVTGGTQQYIWFCEADVKEEPYKIYIQSSKLYFQAGSDTRDATAGIWSCPITNGNHVITVFFWFNADENKNPQMTIDGVDQTVTEETTPVDLDTLGSGNWFIGSDDNGTSNPFNGKIGCFEVWQGWAPTTPQQESLSGCMLMNMALNMQYAKAVCSFPMDEVPEGVAIGGNNTIAPTGDVSVAWSSTGGMSHWDALDGDDANNISADETEDGVVDEISWGTFTKQGTIFLMTSILKYSNTDTSGNTAHYWDGSAYQLIGSYGNGTATSTVNFEGDWTQTNIDGFKTKYTADASIGKNEDASFKYHSVTFYHMNYRIRDLIDATNELVGKDATGGANNYLSYKEGVM